MKYYATLENVHYREVIFRVDLISYFSKYFRDISSGDTSVKITSVSLWCSLQNRVGLCNWDVKTCKKLSLFKEREAGKCN